MRRDEEGGALSVQHSVVLGVANLGPQKYLAAFHSLDSGQNLDHGATCDGSLVVNGKICCESVTALMW